MCCQILMSWNFFSLIMELMSSMRHSWIFELPMVVYYLDSSRCQFQIPWDILCEMSEAAAASLVAPVPPEWWHFRVYWSAIDLGLSVVAATHSIVMLPLCMRMFQLARHLTVTSTCCSPIHQVVAGTVIQAVLAVDGLTRFGGTTTSRSLIFGGVLSSCSPQ